MMRQAQLQMDIMGDQTFAGYTQCEDWNGWARPYFTFEVAQNIVESLRIYQTAHYDTESDELVFEDDGEEERFGAIEVEGQKLYPIGAGSWGTI